MRWNPTTLLIVILAAGCSRAHYRRGADTESCAVLGEKTACTPWELPSEFTIQKDPHSRLADPTDLDCPPLPPAKPRLHTYELPPTTRSQTLAKLQPRAQRPGSSSTDPGQHGQADVLVLTSAEVRTGPNQQSPAAAPRNQGQAVPGPRAELLQQSMSGADYASGLPLRSVPPSAWQAIASACLARMLEFQSVRDEYHRSFNAEPSLEMRDPARRLTLDEIIELALLNSREYQTQKETLYRTALALTLERFDYELKFSNLGNGTGVDYNHARAGGTTANTLRIPSRLQADKMLATGGNVLARFANNVVLTFNGATGFTSDVSSELLFELTQPLIQRDIRLEPLIQSERNVVYAARDFARFRKTFFLQRASEYYTLLRTYRQVEIDSQNYFSLVRALNQAEAEERAGIQSRMQVEQIEQNMLQGRSRLITTCNAVESSLDRLKIAMGLPTELAINLDLTELEVLTLRDEIQVAGERVSRARRRLESHRQEQQPDREQILNAAIVLNDRLIEWLRLRQQVNEDLPQLEPLRDSYTRLRVDDARLAAELARQQVEKVRASVPPSPPILVLQRTMDAATASVRLLHRQHELATRLRADATATAAMRDQAMKLDDRAVELHEQFDTVLKEAKLEQFEALLGEAEQVLSNITSQVAAGDRLIGVPAERPKPDQELKETFEQADQLLATSDELLRAAGVGLAPIDINVDDAMLTALAERLDLMNERGRVADDRRDVKLTADDLKSMLNLNAEQRIRTEKNRPFGFSFDESETRLGLALDLPLNRKAQRNSYRVALIDYQAGLRRLTEREDEIKFNVREELRSLSQARGQYLISVAGAALAAERVLSTRLELTLGFPGVAARDFLEAQDAYSRALSDVAGNRFIHIRERMKLFVDLELMLVDPSGFWPQLYDEQFQPSPRTDLPVGAGPPFGEIPEFLKVSDEIRQTVEQNP